MMNKNYLPFMLPKFHSDELYQKLSKEALALEADDQKKRKAYKKQKKEEKKALTTMQLDLAVASTTEPLSPPAQ